MTMLRDNGNAATNDLPIDSSTVADAELMRRYASAGDEAAFRELVARHLDLVYSVARRRLGGDVHGAADVTQEVFTALARAAAKLPGDVVLPAWLYATTRHLTANRVRAEHSRRAREEAAQRMNELNTEAADATEWESVRPLLEGMLDELPDRDRDAVLLRFFSRCSYAAIGAALQVSEDAARMRVERALEKLRAGLARRGVASSAALGGLLAQNAVTAAPAGMAAGVAGAAVKAAGLFTIMSSTKFVLGLAAAGVISVIGVASLPHAESSGAANSPRPATAVSQSNLPTAPLNGSSTPSAGEVRSGAAVSASGRPPVERTPAAPEKPDSVSVAASLIERRMERLDALVKLSAEQKDRVAALFAKESAALEGIPLAERGEKGQDVRLATRKGVRDVLTDEQRQKYDISPQSMGGGLPIDPANLVTRLDTAVTLTSEQKAKATQIFWDDVVDQAAALPADQQLRGFMWRDAVRGRLREILTPEQRTKFDQTPPYRKNR